jgi:hypothetical protein
VALLNHRFWASRFGARPDIVGAAIEINGAPATIIGVMAEGFDFPMRESFGVSVAVARILQSQLVGVSPYDPATVAAVAFTLVAVALLACDVRARRAMRVDPVVALRHD